MPAPTDPTRTEPPAANLDRLYSLLSLWEASRRAGSEPMLEELCPDDSALREALRQRIEGERLLEVRFRPAADTSVPPTGATRTFDGSTVPMADGLPVISGYTVVRELGRGAMGVVYEAVQTGLNRPAALKMMLADTRPGDPWLMRFLAEAEAVAAVRNPHVVQVYEFGQHAGRPFIAMELCPGSLKERLAAGPLPLREAAELVRKLAVGVQAAHDQQIVHRDLKPGNVLLNPAGEPKVSDFGLAKRGAGADLTRTDAVMGTPEYMAPEQAEGKTKFVGPAADVWALGVILYECLTGARPFTATDMMATMRRILDDTPTPPRGLNPEVPRDLELICLKCLEKPPEGRYATAAGLADDLRRHLTGEPIGIRSSNRFERVIKWSRRNPHRAVAVVMTCATAMLVVLAVGAVWLWRNAATSRAQMEVAAEEATIRRGEAEAARDEAGRARDALADQRERLAIVEYGQMMRLAHQAWRDNNLSAAREFLARARPDLRNWEWRHLHRLCHADARTLQTSFSEVWRSKCKFSPDGNLLALCNNGCEIEIWDTKTWEPAARVGGERDHNKVFGFSPDSTRLATGHSDGTVCVWNATTGALVATSKEHSKSVRMVRFTPDGSQIVTVGEDKTCLVRDVKTQANSRRLDFGVEVYERAFDLNPNGTNLAVAGKDNTIRIHSLLTLQRS